MSCKGAIALGVAALLAAVTSANLTAQASGPIDLHVTDCASWKSIALRDALGQLGGCVSGGYVLFGLEEVLKDGKEPVVDLQVKPGTTVGTALKEILRQLSPYEVEVTSEHLIDLYPKGAKTDPDNLMNLRIPAFNATGKDAYTILGAPRDVIPTLNAALTPKPEPGKRLLTLYVGGYHPPGPPVTLHLKNASVRQVLNAATVASESSFPERDIRGWVYTFDPAKPLSTGYRYTWATLYSLPYGWKYRMRKTAAPSTH